MHVAGPQLMRFSVATCERNGLLVFRVFECGYRCLRITLDFIL